MKEIELKIFKENMKANKDLLSQNLHHHLQKLNLPLPQNQPKNHIQNASQALVAVLQVKKKKVNILLKNPKINLHHHLKPNKKAKLQQPDKKMKRMKLNLQVNQSHCLAINLPKIQMTKVKSDMCIKIIRMINNTKKLEVKF